MTTKTSTRPRNPRLNKRRLTALIKLFESLPNKAVGMYTVIDTDREGETLREASKHTCGTVGCIAGWTILKFGPPQTLVKNAVNGGWFETAQRLLGLEYNQSSRLFYGEWSKKDTSNITRLEVIKALKKLHATGEI